MYIKNEIWLTWGGRTRRAVTSKIAKHTDWDCNVSGSFLAALTLQLHLGGPNSNWAIVSERVPLPESADRNQFQLGQKSQGVAGTQRVHSRRNQSKHSLLDPRQPNTPVNTQHTSSNTIFKLINHDQHQITQ